MPARTFALFLRLVRGKSCLRQPGMSGRNPRGRTGGLRRHTPGECLMPRLFCQGHFTAQLLDFEQVRFFEVFDILPGEGARTAPVTARSWTRLTMASETS